VIDLIQLLHHPDDRSVLRRAGMRVAMTRRMEKPMSNLELWVARAWVRRGARRLQLIVKRTSTPRTLLN
jgi:hypothetical protein